MSDPLYFSDEDRSAEHIDPRNMGAYSYTLQSLTHEDARERCKEGIAELVALERLVDTLESVHGALPCVTCGQGPQASTWSKAEADVVHASKWLLRAAPLDDDEYTPPDDSDADSVSSDELYSTDDEQVNDEQVNDDEHAHDDDARETEEDPLYTAWKTMLQMPFEVKRHVAYLRRLCVSRR